MAYGVRRAHSLKLQQILHGYADGHRQLAASTQLKSRDAKLMLVLSDLSGPGASIDAGGYLTGYPLSESKMYAIARTWPAPEMPRPGCVWTHTLLIDFADLATLADASLILPLFRRPTGADTSDYGQSLEAPLSLQSRDMPIEAEPYARRLIVALYSRPSNRVIASRPVGIDADMIVTGMWSQQWPRLRRAFRFCTLAAADRSSEGSSFDLQLLPSLDRSTRTRFPHATEASDVGDDDPWLQDAVSDLMRPDTSDLRPFLRRIGGDVATGRGAFRPLCRLHALVDRFDTEPDAVDAAIGLLESELGAAQARAARGMVASAALVHSNKFDKVATDFLLRNLDLVEPDVIEASGTALGTQVWEYDPARFVELLEGSERQRSIAESSIAAMDLGALANGIIRTPQLSSMILALRPALVTLEDVWRQNVVPVETAFATLADAPELHAEAIGAMMLADRHDLAPRAAREIGGLSLLQLIASKVKTVGDARSLATWLRAALTDASVAAEFLSSQNGSTWAILSAIAALMPPDAVPNEYGADPWLLAVEAATRTDRSGMPVILSAYLLSRGLGRRSRNPGELACLSFEQVHEATRLNQLPDEAWSVLQARLPWSFNWFDWDRCPRIRAAVGDLFVDRDLQPSAFVDITSKDGLFNALADTISRNGRGRHFLKEVRRWMKDADRVRFGNRIDAIESLLGE